MIMDNSDVDLVIVVFWNNSKYKKKLYHAGSSPGHALLLQLENLLQTGFVLSVRCF